MCIIAGVDSAPETSPQNLSLVIEQFPTIPVIAVVDGSNFEQIFSCGKIGVAEIVLDTELEKLQEKLFLVLNRRQLRGEGGKLMYQIVRRW